MISDINIKLTQNPPARKQRKRNPSTEFETFFIIIEKGPQMQVYVPVDVTEQKKKGVVVKGLKSERSFS
jgi:hypothetical protein